MANVGLTASQWERVRTCIEGMSRNELQGAIEKNTIGQTLWTALHGGRACRSLDRELVEEALRMWKHLAK